MCITFMYVNNSVASPDEFQLIIAFNRDEYFDRPTRPAHFWDENCISGVDCQPGREGGTWFGMNRQTKRIGALLNIVQPSLVADKKPRGHLVIDYLRTDVDTEKYLQQLRDHGDLYNPFNIVLLENRDNCWSVHYCCSNDKYSPRKLMPGVLAFGNTVVDRPWQKVCTGAKQFEEIVQKHRSRSSLELLKNDLLDLMSSRTRHLPDAQFEFDMSKRPTKEFEIDRSAIFVDLQASFNYGTRTTTLLFIDANGQCDYFERTLKPATSSSDDVNGGQHGETGCWQTCNYSFDLNGHGVSANL